MSLHDSKGIFALVQLGCLLALPFERYMRACRSFAVSEVTYGWIARVPPLTLRKSFFLCVHVGSRRLRQASVWLRAATYGGGLYLEVLYAAQLVGILSRIQRTRALTWSCVWDTCACIERLALFSWLDL
eukprot:s726_g39.t1